MIVGFGLCISSGFGCSMFRGSMLDPQELPKEDKVAAQIEIKYLSDGEYDTGKTDDKDKKIFAPTEINEYIHMLKTKHLYEKDDKGNEILISDSNFPSVMKQKRNSILSSLILLIDIHHNQYERNLYQTRAAITSSMDIAVLGLTSAATIAGGEGTKAILAAIATGLNGSRLALEKNFIFEHTTPILLKEMRMNRNFKLNDIKKHMIDDSVEVYTLEQGLVDIYQYFNAGTIIDAMRSLGDKTATTTTTSSSTTTTVPTTTTTTTTTPTP